MARSLMWTRVGWSVGGIAVLWFAVQGGEYGTLDLLQQRQRQTVLEAELAHVRADVDSLRAELRAVKTDPVVLERIARERYGMVRGDKEVLYRVRGADRAAERTRQVDADSVSSDSAEVRDKG